MGFPKQYFKEDPGSPPPLRAMAKRRIRFEEVDMLRIAWHGHYVSYFDDGRVAFGDKYGLSYMAMRDAGVAAPIVQIHIDYVSPLNFDKEITVEAVLHWTDALKLNFEYAISCDGQLAARGYTVQLFIDLKGNVVFIPVDFVADFRQKWQNGEFG